MDIFQYRQILRLTQKEMSGHLGVRLDYYKQVERGKKPLTKPIIRGIKYLLMAAVTWRFDSIAAHYRSDMNQGSIVYHVLPSYGPDQNAGTLAGLWYEYHQCSRGLQTIITEIENDEY